MKVIVTGGRDFDDEPEVHRCLSILKPRIVISGGCTGADEFAMNWAKKHDIYHVTYFADWPKHGKSAGPIRNRRMLEEHTDAILLAFPGGPGTASCVKYAYELHMHVIFSHSLKTDHI